MKRFRPKTIATAHIEAAQEGYKIDKWVLAIENDKGGLEFIETMKTLVNEDRLESDSRTERLERSIKKARS